MSKLPITEQTRQRIREGVLRYYASEAGQQRIRELKAVTPWNKGTEGPEPWNKGRRGAVKQSPEARQRISENSTRRRRICQYSKNMELIKVWPSIAEAIKQLGLSYQAIWYCTTGRRATAGKFIWKYDN